MKNPEFYFQSITIALGIITFVVTHLISKKRDRAVANREIYLNLEMAAIDLFRFEADHIDVIKYIWEDGVTLPKEGKAEHIIVLNYTCQMLNLFEMAIRFRNENVMPPEVFGSWVIWYYELCHAPNFETIWKGASYNYTKDLRQIMNKGIQLSHTDLPEEDKKDQFFEFVGSVIKCDYVKNWFRCLNEEALDRCGP